VKKCRTVVIPGSFASKLTYQLSSKLTSLRFPSDRKECLRVTRLDANPAQVPSPPWRITRSPPASSSSPRRAARGGKVSFVPPASKITSAATVEPNDLVELADHPGEWEVVAAVNGSKADIRRSGGFDTRIRTVDLERLRVVRRAGSPGYSF
jgi:hypothetical protein